MAKKKTPTQLVYSKERKRIQSFLRRAEKRGYVFNQGILPDIPKKITPASVRRLQALTPEVLYSKAKSGVDIVTGEIIPAQEARRIARSEAGKKAAQTRKYSMSEPVQESTNTPGFEVPENVTVDASFYNRTVLSNWYGQLETFANGAAYSLLKAWMGTVIRENGESEAVAMIEKGAEEGSILTWQIVYEGQAATNYISNMTSLIPDQGVFYHDEMMDKIDYMKSLGSALEQDENWERPF